MSSPSPPYPLPSHPASTNSRQDLSQQWDTVPESMTRDSHAYAAGCWKDYRVHEKGHKFPLDNSSLSLSCGSCSVDCLTCFSLGLACKEKRKVLEAIQQCPQCLVQRLGLLLERKSPKHGSTFVSSHLIDIHSRGLVVGSPYLSDLALDPSFLYILLGLFYPLSKVWRSCGIWLSNSFFTVQHREEEHWMFSFYTERLVAKLLWVLLW